MHHLPTLLAHGHGLGQVSSGFIFFVAIVATALLFFAATKNQEPK